MNKKRIAQLAGIAAAIPALLFVNSGSAFADGTRVTWTDKSTGNCLEWAGNGSDAYSLGMVTPPFSWQPCAAVHDHMLWDDVQDNIQDQVGNKYWKETPTGDHNECLTAYGSQAYLEPCGTGGSGGTANYYEQWEERWTGSGFNLVNRMSGNCLDSNVNGDVYVLPCNGGKFQLWH